MATPSLANQSAFSFGGSEWTVTSVSVDSPQPEILNVTGIGDGVNVIRMHPTGAFLSPGRVSVEGFGVYDPRLLVGQKGDASFQTPKGTVSHYCIVESASTSGRVGDVLRFSMTLMLCDP